MTFEELEQAAAKDQPQPQGCMLTDQMCYQALCHLYARFRLGRLDKERAADEKRKIRLSFTTRQQFDECAHRIHKEYRENTLKSSALRVAINKGHDKTVEELFIMAVECIGLMTGDEAFEKNADKVVNRQIALQMDGRR